MLQLASNFEQAGSSKRESTSVPQLDVLAIIRILLRRWRLLAMIVIVGIALGVTYMLVSTPKYTAEFLILVDPTKNATRLSQVDESSSRVIDPGAIESQVEVLKSDSVALMVVRSLNLTKDPMIMGQEPSLVSSIISPVKDRIVKLFRKPQAPPTETELENAAVGMVTRSMKVTRIGVTYVFQVEFTSTNAEKSMRIANALADAYMDSQLQARYDSTRRTASWLQDRLKLLREETSAAEGAVQRYKAENNIVDTARGLMSDQQLADANAQLAAARNDTSAAKARLDRIEEVLKSPAPLNNTVPEALHSEVLNRLRAQYLDLSSRVADLSTRFGPNHGTVVILRNQMNDIGNAAHDELGRIAQSTRSDYEIASNNERNAKANLDALIAQADTTNKASIKLRDLESSAQTYRTLYDNMLQRMQEATQEQSSPDANARVITPATLPDTASSPKLLIVMLISIVGSLAIGFITAISRELLGGTFKTPDDVLSYAGLECLGTLPRVSINRSMRRLLRKNIASGSTLGAHSPVARQTVLAPFSRFTETIRNVKVSIDIARTGSGTMVTGIVSSVPKEGKTTFTANLALLTAQMGHKTLVIDGDMHNPSLTRTFVNQDIKLGLMDILQSRCTFDEAKLTDASTGLDFIPTVIKERHPNIVSLITSEAMIDLLKKAREDYEYVFIDLPPIVPVVDVKASAHLFEHFVFIVEWARTSRDVVYDALVASDRVRQQTVGVILNKADPLELKRIESYRGPDYGSYYVESGHD